MKILYDSQIFSLQDFGGISRYFSELISGFKKHPDIEAEIFLSYSNNKYLEKIPSLQYNFFLRNFEFKGKRELLSILNLNKNIHSLLNQNFHLFHPTYYDTYFLKYIKNKPFVLTIHDLIHEKFPQYFPLWDQTSLKKKALAMRAKKIIAVSHNTKKDIINLYQVEEKKISVIYHANSLLTSPHNLPVTNFNNYILFVGSRNAYKNFIFFIKALKPLLDKDPKLRIVCAGGEALSKKEINLFKTLNILNKVFFPRILSDSYLQSLYQNALAFVFPSLYEGFGIPILEAFACNCPIILSDTSSLPEIAKDAACYFSPYDSLSLKTAIQKIIYNKELRQKLIEKGKNRLKDFSWEKTVQETKNIYQNI